MFVKINFYIKKNVYIRCTCKYEYAGCSSIFLRKDENEHYDTHKDLHLNLLDKFIMKNILEKDTPIINRNSIERNEGNEYNMRYNMRNIIDYLQYMHNNDE